MTPKTWHSICEPGKHSTATPSMAQMLTGWSPGQSAPWARENIRESGPTLWVPFSYLAVIGRARSSPRESGTWSVGSVRLVRRRARTVVGRLFCWPARDVAIRVRRMRMTRR